MPSALGSSQHALLLHSWGRFLARWLSAGKAALGGARGRHKGGLSGGHESSSEQLLMTNATVVTVLVMHPSTLRILVPHVEFLLLLQITFEHA